MDTRARPASQACATEPALTSLSSIVQECRSAPGKPRLVLPLSLPDDKSRAAQAQADSNLSQIGRTFIRPTPGYNALMSRAKARKGTAPLPFERWTPAEDRILDRYVRQLAHGEVSSVYAAARRAHAALAKMPRGKSRRGVSRPRTLCATHSRMLDRVHQICPGRVQASPAWTAEELKVLHECARELKAKGLPNTAGAVRKCQERLQSLGARAGGKRSFKAIAQRLRPIARGYDIPPRRDRWTPEEVRIAKAWARRFLTVKDEVLPWRINEMAALMHVELETKGFKRSRASCKYMLCEMLGRGRRRNVNLDS